MTSHHTVGKITYIHGSEIYPSARNYPPAAPISLGEADPALQQQPPPIPVIAIGDQPRSFGRADLPLEEPDEYTVWAPYPPRAAGKRLRIRWLAVLKWILIPLIIIAAWYFLIDLALQISPF